MRPPFKILYLSPVSFIGGGEESLLTLFKFLDREKFKVLAVLPGPGSFEEKLLKEGIKVEIIPWSSSLGLVSRRSFLSLAFFPLTIVEAIKLLIRLKTIIRRENIDIIHTNGFKCHFLGAILGRWKRARVVWHIREIYTAPFIKLSLRLFKAHGRVKVIAVSRAVKKSLGFKSTLIYNGVDTSLYYPFKTDTIRENLGFSREARIITMLGVLTPWKGQDIFIEAMGCLRDRFPELRALIAGGELYTGLGHKGYLSHLKKKVKTLGLEGRVFFLGFRNNIPAIINSSLAIVHASLEPEPFGRVLIEAMSCGKPVIASRGGAVEEIVRTGIDGLVVEGGDSQVLARAITNILEDEKMALRMGEEGRQRVGKLFSGQKMAKEIEKLY